MGGPLWCIPAPLLFRGISVPYSPGGDPLTPIKGNKHTIKNNVQKLKYQPNMVMMYKAMRQITGTSKSLQKYYNSPLHNHYPNQMLRSQVWKKLGFCINFDSEKFTMKKHQLGKAYNQVWPVNYWSTNELSLAVLMWKVNIVLFSSEIYQSVCAIKTSCH